MTEDSKLSEWEAEEIYQTIGLTYGIAFGLYLFFDLIFLDSVFLGAKITVAGALIALIVIPFVLFHAFETSVYIIVFVSGFYLGSVWLTIDFSRFSSFTDSIICGTILGFAVLAIYGKYEKYAIVAISSPLIAIASPIYAIFFAASLRKCKQPADVAKGGSNEIVDPSKRPCDCGSGKRYENCCGLNKE